MSLLDLVDTRQGTNSQHRLSKGNCLPYTILPFGRHPFVMVTRYNDIRFFNGSDHSNYGIRLTHQPSPWMGDFNFISFNFIGLDSEEEETVLNNMEKGHIAVDYNMSSYRPNKSIFKPHNLSYRRLRDGLNIDLVPTEFGASCEVSRDRSYTIDRSYYFTLTLGKNSEMNQVEQGMLTGFTEQFAGSKYSNYKMHYAMQFDTNLELVGQTEYNDFGHDLVMYWFKLSTDFKDEAIHMNFNCSNISVEQAKENQRQEMKELGLFVGDFAENHEEFKLVAADDWEDYLSRIEVKSQNFEQLRTFYTCLYRSATFPHKAYEFNSEGDKIHFSPYTGKVEPGSFYTSNGYWDTFRTNYPLYSLICPERIEDFIEGILSVGKEDKFLPRWLSPDERGLMPGSSVDSVIADAVVKGLVSDELAEEILEYMIYSAEEQGEDILEGREGGVEYRKLGYVPCDINIRESVNKTQDYAYSDFCIAQVAKALGKDDIAEKYYNYSLNYRNLFQADAKRMLPRKSNGEFVNVSSYRWGGEYTEGSSWQNSLSVFYNFSDLIEMYGGDEEFTEFMVDLINQTPEFEIGSYGIEIHEMSEMAILNFGQLAISNQPSFHFPYLFMFTGYPNLGELVTKQMLTNLFSYDMEGFPGDEDNGSMGSWYVLSSLGLYQVCPGGDEFVFGINIWDDAKIYLPDGNAIHFKQDVVDDYTNVVRRRYVNGELREDLAITYDELMEGPVIEQELAVLPSLRKVKSEFRPKSLKDFIEE